ncbi:hypothetical protein Tco_0262654 [Tanacetum coccineum]
MSEAKTSKKIDWNDPSAIRYHSLKMKPKTITQAKRNMIKYLKNQGNYKISDFKGMYYNEIRPIFEKVWDFNQHIEPMEHGSEKMKSPKKIEEKDVESLSTKYPIVDWKTYTLTENFMYYQIFKGDGSSKNYKVLSEMLEDFDRQDVEELYRLVKERYSASRPSLYDFCGIHILLMQNGIAIHMLTEKKYPLSQEMLSKMLSKRLEVDHESSQAFELLSANGVSTASTYLVLPELVNTARRKINTADVDGCVGDGCVGDGCVGDGCVGDDCVGAAVV